MPNAAAIAVLLVLTSQPAPTAAAIVERYVQAMGGEASLRAVKSRITEGTFDNGHGLTTNFTIIEEAPNRRVTLIGRDSIDGAAGSGRGYDGARGWDKSFIGTGLRTLDGFELADAAREADLLRPLHLLDDCSSGTVESGGATIVCRGAAGNIVRHTFDKRTGLLSAQDIEAGPRKLHLSYDDYRPVGSLRLPFKTHIDAGGATIKYDAVTIRLDQPIDRVVFQQPGQ